MRSDKSWQICHDDVKRVGAGGRLRELVCIAGSCGGGSNCVVHIQSTLGNIDQTDLTRVNKEFECVLLRESGKSEFLGSVWDVDLGAHRDRILTHVCQRVRRLHSQKRACLFVRHKRGRPKDSYHWWIPADGIFQVSIESGVFWRIPQIVTNVLHLLYVGERVDDTGRDRHGERVANGGYYAAVGLREAVRRVCHILPNLHFDRVNANVIHCRTLQR